MTWCFTRILDQLDLRHLTLLPGLIDAHVHHFGKPFTVSSASDQYKNDTIVEKSIRAAAYARRTLLAGYTTVRDAGTEGEDFGRWIFEPFPLARD